MTENGYFRDDYLEANPDLDLLMVDFKMEGLSGDELIEVIRRSNIYLPVIFYSNASVEALYRAAQELQLDGVYIASRSSFIPKVESVIRSLIKKEQTAKQIRGLLVEGVSEIDARLPLLIIEAWSKADENIKEQIHTYVRDQIVQKRAKKADKQFRDFPADLTELRNHFQEKLGSTDYDTHTKCRLAIKLLEFLDYGDDETSILKGFFNGEHSLNNLRNKYAHRTRNELEEEHSHERCVYIRKELRRQIENIENIEALFS